MKRVFTTAGQPFTDKNEIAIALNFKSSHIGLYFSGTPRPGVKQLHLAWHFKLLCEDINSQFIIWVFPKIHPRRAKQVATLCRLCWDRNSAAGIPYAFSSPFNAFNNTGELMDGLLGLTCASFVVAIFHAAGIALVQPDTWVVREDDICWQRKIETDLRDHGASESHLVALRAQIDAQSVRFRPPEVAGSAASELLPASFTVAQSLGVQLSQLANEAAVVVITEVPKQPPSEVCLNLLQQEFEVGRVGESPLQASGCAKIEIVAAIDPDPGPSKT